MIYYSTYDPTIHAKSIEEWNLILVQRSQTSEPILITGICTDEQYEELINSNS